MLRPLLRALRSHVPAAPARQAAAAPCLDASDVIFRPIRPSNCEAHRGVSPPAIAERLAQNHVCIAREIFPASAALRTLAERKMESHLGGNYGLIFSERAADGSIEIDVSVLLHVLRSPCRQVAEHYFDAQIGTSEFILPLLNLVVRKFDYGHGEIDDIKVPWHQDAFGFPGGFRVLNVWTLLSPDECGETAPGLEFILNRFDGMIEKETKPISRHYGFCETSHVHLDELLAAYDPWHPSIRLGDAMIFTELSLHRTYLHSSQRRTRYSAEVRLVGRSQFVVEIMADIPHFLVSRGAMSGPSRISQLEDGSIKVLEQKEWRL